MLVLTRLTTYRQVHAIPFCPHHREKKAQAITDKNYTVPGAYSISPTLVSGLKDIKLGASSPLASVEAVKDAITATIERVKAAGGIPNTASSNPRYVAFNSHTPYELRVSSDAIKGGFYGRLNALQGAKSTYYTGAAFERHGSSEVWAFTEGVVKNLLAA